MEEKFEFLAPDAKDDGTGSLESRLPAVLGLVVTCLELEGRGSCSPVTRRRLSRMGGGVALSTGCPEKRGLVMGFRRRSPVGEDCV